MNLRLLLRNTGLLLSLTACDRLDGDTLCEGMVLDRHTNLRVANATIGVYEAGSSGGGLGGGYVLKETHQADAQGNFAFQLEGDSDDRLLRAFTDQGYETSWQEAPRLRGGRNNKKLVVKAQAPAWLRIELVDQGKPDSVHFHVWGSFPSASINASGSGTTMLLPVRGNMISSAYWRITSPLGSSATGSQEVYCPGLDTTTIQIFY